VSDRPLPIRVVFVLSTFPCDDETFLLREIVAIAERAEVWIFSLKRSRDTLIHAEAKPLLAHTLAPAYLLSIRVLGALCWLAATRPRRGLQALLGTIAAHWRSPEFLLKNLVLFPKAVVLARWALERGATVLHGGWATYPAAAARSAAQIAGLPYSFAAHAHDIYLDSTGIAPKLRGAAFVTTCTRSNREHLLRLAPDLPPGRVEVLHHGIQLDRFAGGSPGLRPLSLLSVGTLNPHKGFEPLLRALALLRERDVDFRCSIVGGGPLEDTLRRSSRELGLQELVTLHGALEQAEVAAHYRRAAVFALLAQPEWHWGIPNVIVEALAAGNAVVTTRFGSVEELVQDGRTGLLVPPRDAARIADALERLARDPEERDRLARAGREIVEREFDLGRTASRLLQLLGGSRGEPREARP
jgi:glycosyltransferase involved in cell wall biosynthesis